MKSGCFFEQRRRATRVQPCSLCHLKAAAALNCGRSLRVSGIRGDRWFESGSLRRRVYLTGVFGGSRRKSPAFAGSVSLDVTRERDVLARSGLALASFSDGH
jgi:hypothetical protein